MNKYKLSYFLDKVGDGIHGTPEYDDNGEYYFINGNNLGNANITINNKTLKINKSEYEKIKRPLTNNTLLISINGTLGNISFYNGENIALGKSACYLNVKPEFNRNYIKYVLSTKEFQKYMDLVSSCSTIKNVAPGQIADYQFFAPDCAVQNKIAKVLSVIDKKIDLNNRMNEKLEAMAKRLYDYWFVQFDFPNEDGKPYKSSGGKMVYNEQLKRDIPEGWEDSILIDISNITMGQSPEGSSYNENGDGIIFYQGSTDFGHRFPDIRTYTTEPKRFAKMNDILFSVRAPVGEINIANNDCCIGRGLAAINSKYGSMTYLFYLLKSFQNYFNNASGTTFSSITKDDLFNLPVLKPKSEIIQNFENIVHSFAEKQTSIDKEQRKLIKLRDKLLPLIMNGQVVVEQSK